MAYQVRTSSKDGKQPPGDRKTLDARAEELIADFRSSEFLRSILRTIESHAASEQHALLQENDRLRGAFHRNISETRDSENKLAIGKLYSGQSGEKFMTEVSCSNEYGPLASSLPSSRLDTTIERGSQMSSQANDTVVHTEVRVHGPSDCWHATVVTDVSAKRASESAWSGARNSSIKAEESGSMQPKETSRSVGHRRTSGLAFFKNASKTMRLSLGVGGPMFADLDDIKKQVQLALVKKPYDVAEFYSQTGVCQYIARSQCFEFLQLFVIAVNSIWIAVDVDVNGTQSLFDSAPAFIVAEFGFVTFFTLEWVVRFGAFASKSDCLKDAWFIFDSMLLGLMVLDVMVMPLTASESGKASDTSVLKLLRITRLARMGRMAHLLNAMPELTILLKAIGIAGRSVFYTLILLAIVIYIFSVAFRHLTDGSEVGDLYFPTVPEGMRSLLLYGILPDNADIADKMSAEDTLYLIIFLFFILAGSLTVMNMLVGVLVEVVSVVSHLEKEQLKVTTVKQKLFDMLNTSGLAADEDMVIERSHFESLLVNPSAARVIHEVGVDPVALVEFTDHIFSDVRKGDKGLKFESFIGWILALRGSNNATVKDIVDLRQFIIQKITNIEDSLHSCEGKLVAAFRGEKSKPYMRSQSSGNYKDKYLGFAARSTHSSNREITESTTAVETLGIQFSPVVPTEESGHARPPSEQPAFLSTTLPSAIA